MAESSPTHDHIEFRTESITGARVCTGCGAFVLSSLQDEHQAFHDSVAVAASEALIAANAPTPRRSPRRSPRGVRPRPHHMSIEAVVLALILALIVVSAAVVAAVVAHLRAQTREVVAKTSKALHDLGL